MLGVNECLYPEILEYSISSIESTLVNDYFLDTFILKSIIIENNYNSLEKRLEKSIIIGLKHITCDNFCLSHVKYKYNFEDSCFEFIGVDFGIHHIESN